MNRLHEHIAEQARSRPQALAVADPNGEVSYAELMQLIDAYSKHINELQIRPSSRIMLSGNNSIELLALIITLIKEQMNFFLLDPRTSEEEAQNLLTDIRVNFLFFEKGLLKKNMFASDILLKGANTDFEITKKSSEIFSDASPKIYFFSSGSTGKPKAFGYTDEQLWMQMQNMASHMGFHAGDRSLVPLTITHSHGLMLSLPLLLCGGSVHYLLPNKSKPEDIQDCVEKNKISILTGVPYQYNLMLQSIQENAGLLRTLRYAFCGSAPMSEYLAVSFLEKYGVLLHPAYGVSEIGPICINLFEEGDHNFRSVGKVMPGIDYKILDEKGTVVIPGQEGELVVGSDFMSNEYINAPEESAQTFRDGWIYTQDIVREDEYKNIYIVGRLKNFINVSGYKIYPVEVEKVILSMKGIKDAAVLGVPDEARGQIIQAMVSTFFPVKEDAIRDFCKQHLAAYKIPHQIVIQDELVHTSINKVSYSKYSNVKFEKKL